MPYFKHLRAASIFGILGLGAAGFIDPAYWLGALAILLCFLGLIVAGAFTMRFGIFLKAYCNPNISGRSIALTFDDGPAPTTENVLDLLQQYGVKASFFCIGQQIEKYPKIFGRIIDEGHLIGNHSYSHSRSFPFFSRKHILKELDDTDALIGKYRSGGPQLFRPPFGVTNPKIAAALARSGHEVIGWNLRSYDTVSQNPEKLLMRLKAKIKPGTVLLLHDNLAHTAQILEGILQFAEKENYQCLRADEIFELES